MASIKKKELPSGEVRYALRWRDSGGRQQTKSFRKRGDAEAALRKVRADEMVGITTDFRGSEVRLDTFATSWLASRLSRGRPLSDQTLHGYRGLLRRNLLPHLGKLPLRAIQPETVRDWYTQVASEASGDQAAKSYRLLRAILNTAVDDGLLARNPCRIKGGGTERTPERPVIDTPMALKLAGAIDPRYRSFIEVAAFGGLRSGEMLALRVRDVDLLHGTVKVREAKTEAGRRTVQLPKEVASQLGRHIDTYAQPGPDGAVFTGPKGGPLRPATVSAAWDKARTAAGAPAGLHIHDLRHHSATMTARMPGVTTKELMARLGHASPRAALIYQHATRERDAEIASWWDTQLEAAKHAPRPVQIRGA